MTENEKRLDYLKQLRKPFQKLCRARFLNPDGSTAFAVDNNPNRQINRCYIAEGSITANLQNGSRRTSNVVFNDPNGDFDYNVNHLWFGTEIAIDEGLILSDGSEYYIQQGIFLPVTPTQTLEPGVSRFNYPLIDKWANLDGQLHGNLEGTYEVAVGTNIFQPIRALLALDRGNGLPVDAVTPIFTEYYNNMTQTLTDGSVVAITDTPYTLTATQTYAEVILGLASMLNAWVGYDSSGALRLDPSQDDIEDSTKPIMWQFSKDETQILGSTYEIKNTEVYNDYIIVGEQLEDYTQPAGRAQNLDPSSDTNVNLIGRKTIREDASGFATVTQCVDLAVWKLKRASALRKAVSISCTQMFHISENQLVTIVRTDKQGSPVERHLVQGFTRPLASTANMTLNCVSTIDMPQATVTPWH